MRGGRTGSFALAAGSLAAVVLATAASAEVLSSLATAREAGMMASTAVAGGGSGKPANPATLGDASGVSLSGTFVRLLDASEAQQIEAVARTSLATLGLSAGIFRTGDMEVVEASGVVGVVEAQRDVALGVSLGRQVGGGVGIGAGARWHRSTLVEAYAAETVAFDAGARWSAADRRVSLGASVRGIGGEYRYVDTASRLPLVSSAGMAWRLVTGRGLDVLLAADVAVERGLPARYSAGTEFGFLGGISLRGGVQWDGVQTQFGAGIGINLGRIQFDCAARQAAPGLDPVPQGSLTVRL